MLLRIMAIVGLLATSSSHHQLHKLFTSFISLMTGDLLTEEYLAETWIVGFTEPCCQTDSSSSIPACRGAQVGRWRASAAKLSHNTHDP